MCTSVCTWLCTYIIDLINIDAQHAFHLKVDKWRTFLENFDCFLVTSKVCLGVQTWIKSVLSFRQIVFESKTHLKDCWLWRQIIDYEFCWRIMAIADTNDSPYQPVAPSEPMYMVLGHAWTTWQHLLHSGAVQATCHRHIAHQWQGYFPAQWAPVSA